MRRMRHPLARPGPMLPADRRELLRLIRLPLARALRTGRVLAITAMPRAARTRMRLARRIGLRRWRMLQLRTPE